jgi:hypothetical protein
LRRRSTAVWCDLRLSGRVSDVTTTQQRPTSASTVHPLEPLTAEEITRTVDVFSRSPASVLIIGSGTLGSRLARALYQGCQSHVVDPDPLALIAAAEAGHPTYRTTADALRALSSLSCASRVLSCRRRRCVDGQAPRSPRVTAE